MSTYKKGDIVIGTVANVRPYAVFLNFPDGAVGLLHISEISDSFIRDIEKYASIGDEIKVIVISVDPDNGFLRLSLKRVPEEERFSTHTLNDRKPIKTTKDDFAPLEEKLTDWISETLEKAKKDEEND